MLSRNTSRKKIIVGAGVSGATAARELVKSGVDPKDIIVLEMNDYIGGKLKTYSSPTNPDLKTEYGAGVLVHNYPAIDVMHEKGIKLERLIDTDYTTLDMYKDVMSKSVVGMFTYALNFVWQQMKFGRYVWSYNQACNHLEDKLPADYELSFAQFADKKGLENVASFLQFLMPGFGYGSLDDKNNYAFHILNYMGYTTIPSICAQSLVAVHGGYQQLVEKMLEGIDVKTSAHIKEIERNNGAVKVQYEQNGKMNTVEGDMLVLANSPYYWKDLNMKLSPEEQKCVDNLTYYRYPVAICRIKGLPPKQIFIPEAIQKEGFGHAAFLFTRDNRKDPEDGRLFTVYINLPQGANNFSLDPGSPDRETILNDLKKLPGVTEVHMDDATVWKDYNPCVPWSVGIDLQKEELKHANNTLHVGTYLPGSFETVAGAGSYAEKATQHWLKIHKSLLAEATINLRRTLQFFTLSRQKPYQDSDNDKKISDSVSEDMQQYQVMAPAPKM